MLLKPLSHQTVMPQRLYSVLKPCQRAVGLPRNTPKTIKFVSYSVYTTSSQHPYSVHTTFPQRPCVFTARKQLLQLVHSAHTLWKRQAAAFVLSMLKIDAATWRSRWLHSVSTEFPQRCWHLHSAHLGVLQFFLTLCERCKDATLVWQGFQWNGIWYFLLFLSKS